jgi:dihydrofolate synthase/folylpolyglutamate synthase
VTYQESLAWLYSTQQFGIKLGLENTTRLLEDLGNPHDAFRILHVAGTNGKGSVCAMLDAILRRAGHRTGLYTSPHLIDFRERIRVDGRMIAREAVAAGLTRIRDLSSGWDHSPTFFEITTVLALEHFAASGCEYVVLETGMGGRLDATNAVTPVVSVITPVAMDHSEWLGDTIAAIAGEKAGIIKPGVPTVSAPQRTEAAEVIRARAGQAVTFVTEPWTGELPLEGEHQKWNAAAAVAALQAAGIYPAAGVVNEALREVRWPARFQRVGPNLVVDGAHNPHAADALVKAWRTVFPGKKAVVVFGALRDKDYEQMIDRLGEIASEFWFAPVTSARAADLASLAPLTSVRSKSFDSLSDALGGMTDVGGPYLITGSLFLAGEALQRLGVELDAA